jgi:hypothetical protein
MAFLLADFLNVFHIMGCQFSRKLKKYKIVLCHWRHLTTYNFSSVKDEAFQKKKVMPSRVGDYVFLRSEHYYIFFFETPLLDLIFFSP